MRNVADLLLLSLCCALFCVHAQTVTATVSVGTPSSLVVNPVTNKIYVANYHSANVTVIEGPPTPPPA